MLSAARYPEVAENSPILLVKHIWGSPKEKGESTIWNFKIGAQQNVNNMRSLRCTVIKKCTVERYYYSPSNAHFLTTVRPKLCMLFTFCWAPILKYHMVDSTLSLGVPHIYYLYEDLPKTRVNQQYGISKLVLSRM